MNPTFCDILFLQHLANACAHFRRPYIKQSRETQRALIYKGYGVLIAESTFDRSIRKDKEREWTWKRHRSGSVAGMSNAWKTSLTFIKWRGVMFLKRAHLISKETFEELKRILGMLKKRGPKELSAPPALIQLGKRSSPKASFPVPT